MKKNTENQMVAMVSFSNLSCGGCENLSRDCVEDSISGFGVSINASDAPALAAELEKVLRRYESNSEQELIHMAEKRRELERWAHTICSWAKNSEIFVETDTVYSGNRTRVYGWVGYDDQELFMGEASCDDEDEFSPTIGKAIAIYRLMKKAGEDDLAREYYPPKDSGIIAPEEEEEIRASWYADNWEC